MVQEKSDQSLGSEQCQENDFDVIIEKNIQLKAVHLFENNDN